MRPSCLLPLCTLLALSVVRGTLDAQSPFSSDVEGTAESKGIVAVGVETVRLKPDRIRLVMWVSAQGIDAKSAITALARHRSRVKEELVSMKADETSIQFSAARLSKSRVGGNSRNQGYLSPPQIRKLMRDEESGIDKLPSIYIAMSALMAEWPLPIQEGDALALLPITLGEQIESRDLAGKKNKPKLDPAQQEQMNELETVIADQLAYFSEDESAGPGIAFIATVSDEMIESATKSACEKAATKAALLAKASGVTLGKLNSLSGIWGETSLFEQPLWVMANRSVRNATFPSRFVSTDGIVSAADADELAKTVRVVVSYSIMWE